MNASLNINHLNDMPQAKFTLVLADIFEHSSWIPERVWLVKPFDSIDHLLASMVAIVEHATADQKLSLLRAHPQLAGKEAKRGKLTNASTEEQSGANLNSLSNSEMNEINHLNDLYQEKH